MAFFIVYRKLPALAMAVYPFILFKDATSKNDTVLINHERIHLRQQLEMLIIFFYVAYLIHYLINRLKKQSHYTAYRNIVFEREAYLNEKNLAYLNKRKPFLWLKYF